MPISFEPKYASCNDPRHTAFDTPSKKLDRVYLSDIKQSRYTGVVNVVVLRTTKNLRLAYETSDRSSCGQRLNGHCHLGKVNGVQDEAYCAGQWHFIDGDLRKMTNATGTYRPCGETDRCEEAIAHKDRMYESACEQYGADAMVGVEYIGSKGNRDYITRFFQV